jgi:plasmid stability protein
MGQVIIRNLDDNVVGLLKDRAARRGHSLEQELRDIVCTVASNESQKFLDRSAELRRELSACMQGREFPDLTAMIREDRDR